MLQRYIRALADLSVNVKRYHRHFLAALLGTQNLVVTLRNVNISDTITCSFLISDFQIKFLQE